MNIYDKAQAAARLKENDDFKALIACVEAEIFESFKNVKVADDETLKQVHTLSLGFNLFRNRLDKYEQLARLETSKSDGSNDENH